MLYSQLYRSILQACRELSRRPHYTGRTNRLIISLPLLISVPSAYGAIVSPQVEAASSVNSTEHNSTQLYTAEANNAAADNRSLVNETTPSSVSSMGQVSTLQDHSSISYKSLSTTSSSSTTINSKADQTDVAESNSLVKKSNNKSQSKKLNNTEEEALEAVGFEPQSPSEVPQEADNSVLQSSITYPEDEYIQPTTATDIVNSNSPNSAQTAQKGRRNTSDSNLRAPTNPNRASAFPSTESSNSGLATSNQAQTDQPNRNTSPSNASETKKTTLGQRVDDSRELADSFKQDSVQKSLQRLSKYYQQQATELRDRINQNQVKQDSSVEDNDQQQAWSQFDAVTVVEQAGKQYPLILVDQGAADDFYIDGYLRPEALQHACQKAEQPLTLRYHAGYDHSYYFIQTVIEDHIEHHYNAALTHG